MKDKIYYYDRNGVLKLTLNEYPYYTEWADLRDWQWGYNEQFGRYTSFRRDKHERELIIAIAGDYLKAHDDLCDIFAADVIAGQPGQLRANDWTLNCYITEAEYEYGHGLSRKAVFKVMSEDPAWIRKNTRVLSGESAGETETDYGRDYTEGLIEAGSDTAPYLFRQSPQFSNGYNRETDLLVGGTIAWNQLVANSGSVSVTVPSGHKYYSSISGTKTIANSSGTAISATGGSDNIIDLTQMFDSTIADYIYSLEQANAGAGVAWFKKLFPKDYYEYNAGELISVNALRHDTVGFNQWDEEWEVGGVSASTGEKTTRSDTIRSKNYIPVIGGTDYFMKMYSQFVCYDSDKRFIASVPYTTIPTVGYVLHVPIGASYAMFMMPTAYGTTYNNDICINISDTAKNGTYEPYVKHSYPLDDSLTLRGIPKLSNGKLYYDGDTYEADGTVTRKYGIVDLGTLNWVKNNEGIWAVQFIETPNASGVANLVCPKYRTTTWSDMTGNDKTIAKFSNNYMYVHDTAYTTAADFKTAMSGVYLVYELATPTTETAEPYTNPQVVDNSGTEEYVSTSIVPVGHQTAYGLQAALRGYNYGYSLTDVHTTEIVLPSSQNGYEVLFYGPITNPAIYLNGHPVQVYVTLTAGQRLRVVSNGSEKTIKILSSTGVETDAFIYRNKEFSPFINIGQHTEVSFGDFRFEFTTIERRSEPTWT